MASKSSAAEDDEEANRVHRAEADTVNRVHRLKGVKFRAAKVVVGRAVAEGIGTKALKEFGHKGLISGVISGEKVPDYLAAIVDDPKARRRFAKALLSGDPKVKRQTVYVIDDDDEDKE